jgi:hypothetical protein
LDLKVRSAAMRRVRLRTLAGRFHVKDRGRGSADFRKAFDAVN